MPLNLGLCPCCVPPVALSFLSAALVVVVSARMFFPRQGKVGKLLKFLTWSCVAMNVAMAGFLVALKSNKDLQDSFFSKLCLKLSSDPAMLPPRCERLGLSTKLAGLNVSEITNAGPEDWRTRDGGLMKVRDVVGLVMLRFETKQPPDSNGWLYSDTSRLTIMDDRTVAERGEDRTFKLMSWIGTSGPTYLTQ